MPNNPHNSVLTHALAAAQEAHAVYCASGLWQSEREDSLVIEIIGKASDLQNIVYLAGDIRTANRQSTVLVSWHLVLQLVVMDERTD